MADTADSDKRATIPESVAAHVQRLIGLDIPEICVPGVVAGLEGLEAHLTVLRSAEQDR